MSTYFVTGAPDAFSRVAASGTAVGGATFTSVRMPLVRPPAFGPTKVCDAFPATTPERAARRVVRARERRPEDGATWSARTPPLPNVTRPVLRAVR